MGGGGCVRVGAMKAKSGMMHRREGVMTSNVSDGIYNVRKETLQ